ncbi:DUF1800 domain-containing protein [Daejeonella sp.]|uniref:DUF1800 domain-containing protein n=1 Tax=Daejeonella sp. TaxID=2805397 RepID=UPI0030BA96E3
MPVKPYTGTFGKNELIHLLKRSLFGVKRIDIAIYSGKTLTEVLNSLLGNEMAVSPPVNNYNDATLSDLTVPDGQPWISAPYENGTINSRRVGSFTSWWTGMMLEQAPTLREKMVLFWHNHFATETTDVGDARYSYKTNALLRTYCYGNFRELVKQVSIDPGMLRYLNGYLNTKTAPDENYARELQELFTLGKGPGSKYTESDVKAAAKVLTGYRLDAINITSTFDATRHDITDKQFSSFYNNTIIKGQTGLNGAKELDDMLNMIFLQNEVSLYICRRLYRFFIYYDITPTIESTFIAPLAELFRASNYEIKPVLQAMFSSEHFFLNQNRGCMIKSPLEFTVGLCREFEISFPIKGDYINQYYMWAYIKSQAAAFQQDVGDPPNVAGWPAYYQEPQFYELWINSDTIAKRNVFTDRFISSGYTRNNQKIVIDPIAYTSKFANPGDPNALIDEALDQLYRIDVSTATRTFLKSILLSNQVLDYYWTTAWTDHKTDPTNVAKKNIVNTRLVAMFKYMMNLAEYQLA